MKITCFMSLFFHRAFVLFYFNRFTSACTLKSPAGMIRRASAYMPSQKELLLAQTRANIKIIKQKPQNPYK